jgi:predicted small lipoprotein YifL
MKRAISIVAVLAAAVALAGCGGDDESTTTTTATQTDTETQTQPQPPPPPPPSPPPGPTVVRVTVRGGVPAGGVVRETVDKGDRVVLVVRSDVADEVHLHGYDLSRDVEAGGQARIPFRATVAGRFEVELEERGVPIAELTVEP